jgi:hypothetical protein
MGDPADDHQSTGQGLSSELQYFEEKERCCWLIARLCFREGESNSEQDCAELIHILDKYLEQPLLVAAHAVELLGPINDAVQWLAEQKV